MKIEDLDFSILEEPDTKTGGPISLDDLDFSILDGEESFKLDIEAKPLDKPITDQVPGTVTPLDTTQTVTPEMGLNPDAVSEEEGMRKGTVGQMEGVARGSARLLLGAGKLGQETINKITDKEYSIVDTWIKENEKTIKEKELDASALAGEILINMAMGNKVYAGGKITSAFGVGLLEGGLEATASIGQGLETEAIAKRAGIAAITAGGGTAIINKVVEAVGPLSHEAKLLLQRNQNRISEEEAIDILKEVPKEDQVLALANRLKLARKNINAAVGDQGTVATKLGSDLEARKNVIDDITLGNSDVQKAQAQWSDMLDNLEGKAPGQFSTKSFEDDLKYIDNIYGLDPGKAGKLVKVIKASTDKETLSVTEALDVRKGINRLIDKASKGTDEIKHLNNIKNSLDNFIGTIVTKEQKELIDNTISNYSRVVNNNKLEQLVAKNTKEDFAVDWKKLDKDIAKAGLHSKELNLAKPIIKEFSKRFKNDAYLAGTITPRGSRADAGGVLTIFSKLVGIVKDAFNPIFNRSRYKDLKIQKSILNSIKNSKTNLDFVEDIKKNINVPTDIKEDIVTLLEYKPGATKTLESSQEVLTTTKKGTVSTNPSEGIMKERSEDLMKEFINKNLDKPEDITVKKAMNALNNNRLTNVAEQISKKMRINEDEANLKLLNKLVINESEELIKFINKQTGVKLPQKEAEKIIKHKLNELYKECNEL